MPPQETSWTGDNSNPAVAERPQQGCLAAPGRTKQAGDLAATNIERKVAYRGSDGLIRAGKVDRQMIDLESDMGYVTPAEIAGEDAVFISRVREDPTVENGLNFWCVADNLRKGAALNAVQIAERLVKDYL